MPANKRISSSYSITTTEPLDTITLNTHTLSINGNLMVTGNVIQTSETVVYDNIITLNANLTGIPSPTVKSGIEVNRGSYTDTSVLWNEQYQKWQLTNDGTNFANIAVVSTGNGNTAIRSLSEDSSPKLAGNLDTNSSTIYSSTSNVVRFEDNVAIKTTTVAPSAMVNNVVVYSSSVSSGGSGLYVSNSVGNDELVTKRKAFVFSIIL